MIAVKTFRNARGFTLIEILIAITLLAIGLLGMAGLTVGIMRGNSLSSEVTSATALAQDKMEDIKRQGYAGAASLAEPYNTISGYARFRRSTVVDVDTPSVGMKNVTVTVYWDADTASVAVETILTP